MANKNEQTVQETVTKSEAFFDKNKKAIAYGVIAILVIIAGFFFFLLLSYVSTYPFT